MTTQVIQIKGERFVVIPEREYQRLQRDQDQPLPADPPTDKQGNMPAVEFSRAALARKIIQERTALGLTQQELAKKAGIRQETLSRLESGKHSPTLRTVDKIDAALQTARRQIERRKLRKA